MNPKHNATLISSITSILTDYRQNEIKPITPQHVERWLNQFDEQARPIILQETERLLRKRYVSRARMAQDIQALMSEVLSLYNEFDWYKLEFLQIQRKGSSQRDLLDTMVPEVLALNPYFEEPEVYVYLDDCLFSGNSLFHDIRTWLEHEDVRDKELHILFHTVHSAGWEYVQRRLTPLFQERNIVTQWEALTVLENRTSLRKNHPYDCLWAIEDTDDPLVAAYVQKIQERAAEKGWSPRLFRPSRVELRETLFSSPQARETVEQAFLKYGAYIVSLPRQAKSEMRPLGYEYLESLGFGAMYVTHRNIANNCPLVLWWGDPSYPANHPFSKWYPLLPRRSNEQIRNGR